MSTSLMVSDAERPETKDDPGRPKDGDSERAPSCDHFVILSMQRSGSRDAEKILNDDPSINASMRCEGEFFNFDEGQPGRTHADFLKVTPDEVRQHGVQWWYQKVFEKLEQVQFQLHGAQSPCAVGFRAFENPDVYGSPDLDGTMDFGFNSDEMDPLLTDPAVKKIILERRDTAGQWLSNQRGCRFGDMSDHHAHDSHSDQLSFIIDKALEGHFCGPQVIGNYTRFKKMKCDMYGHWRYMLNKTSQSYITIQTEDLDKLKADPSQLREFLFPIANHVAK